MTILSWPIFYLTPFGPHATHPPVSSELATAFMRTGQSLPVDSSNATYGGATSAAGVRASAPDGRRFTVRSPRAAHHGGATENIFFGGSSTSSSSVGTNSSGNNTTGQLPPPPSPSRAGQQQPSVSPRRRKSSGPFLQPVPASPPHARRASHDLVCAALRCTCLLRPLRVWLQGSAEMPVAVCVLAKRKHRLTTVGWFASSLRNFFAFRRCSIRGLPALARFLSFIP